MRLIPLIVVLAFFSISLRAMDVFLQSQNINSHAFAKEEVKREALPEPNVAPEKEETQAVASETGDEDVPDLIKGLTLFDDEVEFDPEFARSEIEVLQDLAKRRKELDKREVVLEQKEAILKATEAQLSQKIDELTAIRDELTQLLEKQSEEEQRRIRSLVKIYESMKPKDAANILNALDTGILLSVMELMSERKSSPIIAEMDADRAREITTLLAERVKLPDIDEF